MSKIIFKESVVAFFLLVCLNSHASNFKLLSFYYPPYMEIYGEKPGLAMDVVKEAFFRMREKIDIEFYPLARSFSLLEHGYGDGMLTVKKNKEREERFIFSKEPIFTQEMVFFVRVDSKLNFNGKLDMMSNSSIGVLNKAIYGEVFDSAVKNGILKKIEVSATDEFNFKKMLAGRMDAVICGKEVGLEILKRMSASSLARIAGAKISTTGSYIAFAKNNRNAVLVKKFDAAMQEIKRDGSFSKIYRNYMASNRFKPGNSIR